MSPTSTHIIPQSPGVLSLLPMFYIGWADSVLSPSEIKLIHKKIDGLDHLSKEEKKYLIRWTDPKNPPSETVFKEWVHALQNFSNTLNDEQRKSISSFCYQILASTMKKKDFESIEPGVFLAIKEIESALGIDNPLSARLLMGRMSGKITLSEEASFDVNQMRKELDGKYMDTKERMRTLLQDPYFERVHYTDKEQYRLHILSRLKALAKQGLGAYAFPEKYGGAGKTGDHIAVFEMLGFGDLSLAIKFGVQFGLFGGSIFQLGTFYHHNLYIEPLCKGDLLGCFAMTETGHGSDVRGLRTTATYNAGQKTIVIHTPYESAGKEYIGNALHASMAVVFAQLIVEKRSHGVHAILVPLRDGKGNLMPGVRVEDNGYKMGLNGVDNGKIWFDHVEVPKANLLNAFGDIDDEGKYISRIENPGKRFFTMLGALVGGRISVGLAAVSVSKSALNIAVNYSIKRRQFEGKEDEDMLIMDYPTHQRRLIPLVAKTVAYHVSLSRLVDNFIKPESDRRDIETQAAALKALATWHNTRTVQDCREACGGKGYLHENLFADLKADSDVFTTFEGDNIVLFQLVARSLLTEFKQSFHEEGFRAVIRYLGKRISHTVAEYNPIYSRMTSSEHLLDKKFYQHAFKYREKKLLISLSARMRDYLKKRLHPHDAFLKCQVHLVDTARAYGDNLVLKDFISFVDSAEPSLHPVLNRLLSLYALTVIEEEKGWFLETGYMEGSKTKAIRRMVTKLCAELRPDVKGLVDSFGIPPQMVHAEILRSDMK